MIAAWWGSRGIGGKKLVHAEFGFSPPQFTTHLQKHVVVLLIQEEKSLSNHLSIPGLCKQAPYELNKLRPFLQGNMRTSMRLACAPHNRPEPQISCLKINILSLGLLPFPAWQPLVRTLQSAIKATISWVPGTACCTITRLHTNH